MRREPAVLLLLLNYPFRTEHSASMDTLGGLMASDSRFPTPCTLSLAHPWLGMRVFFTGC
jgi:hypothetical protein